MAIVPLLAAVCAAGPTLPGIDVSVYQGTIDWAAVRAGGIEFAYIRASNGAGIPDALFEENWSGARAAGVLRGAYQYFRPGQDALAQADLLLERMGPLATDDLPPALDVEETDGMDAAAIVAGMRVWLDRVESATGRRPILYTGLYFWMDEVDGSADFAAYPLWIPQYGPACPTLPPPWTEWAFFQYSATGSVAGIGGDVDRNHFNGDRAALLALAATPPPAPPDDAGGCAAGGRRATPGPAALVLGAILILCCSSSIISVASRTPRISSATAARRRSSTRNATSTRTSRTPAPRA